MQTVTLATLVVLAGLLLVTAPPQADAVCCHPQWTKGRTGCCSDDTNGTPYCGVGPCNVFGCKCEGGCRRGEIRRDDDELTELQSAEQFLSGADVNGDGVLSVDELNAILQTQPAKNGTCQTKGARAPPPNKGK